MMDTEEQFKVCEEKFMNNKSMSGTMRWIIGVLICLFTGAISWGLVVQSDVSTNKANICNIEKRTERIEKDIQDQYQKIDAKLDRLIDE